MDKAELKKFMGKVSMSIVDAMKLMDDNGAGILFMVDNSDGLIGSLTDGDIRRWLINTGELDARSENLIHMNPRFLRYSDSADPVEYMIQNRIKALPILDCNDRIIDIVFNSYGTTDGKKIKKNALRNIPIVIMAGGKGTRLYPYTKILPKPLIPIGDVPILERILQKFCDFGAEDFYLTVNYKKEMIKSYFSELVPLYKICYIEENEPLGTAGSIRLIDKDFKGPLIITNCDILIEADYGEILKYHQDSGNDLTIVSSLKNMTIPYGVIRMQEHGIIESMEEKPTISYFINTGMYVMDSKHVSLIPKEKTYHMTTLVQQLMDDGYQVGTYPISENSFFDMGEFEEMKKMEDWVLKGKVH